MSIVSLVNLSPLVPIAGGALFTLPSPITLIGCAILLWASKVTAFQDYTESASAHDLFTQGINNLYEGNFTAGSTKLLTAYEKYISLSDRAMESKKYDQALEYLSYAFAVQGVLKNELELGNIHVKKALAYLYKQEFQKAYEAGEQAELHYKSLGEKDYNVYSIYSHITLALALLIGERQDELLPGIFAQINKLLPAAREQYENTRSSQRFLESMGLDFNILEELTQRVLSDAAGAIEDFRRVNLGKSEKRPSNYQIQS